MEGARAAAGQLQWGRQQQQQQPLRGCAGVRGGTSAASTFRSALGWQGGSVQVTSVADGCCWAGWLGAVSAGHYFGGILSYVGD